MNRSSKIFLLIFNAVFFALAIWGIFSAYRAGSFIRTPDQYQKRVTKIQSINNFSQLKQEANAYLELIRESDNVIDHSVILIKKAMMGFIVMSSVNGLFLLISFRKEN